MKHYPPRIARRARHVRVPAFSPVPLRGRADGWTPGRQAAFLGVLAETGSVVAAARAVGMARETAYRLRRREGADSFAAAWDAVARPRRTRRMPTRPVRQVSGRRPKVTLDDLARRALDGVLKPRIWQGRFTGIQRKPDNRALLRALARLDRTIAAQTRLRERSHSFTGADACAGWGV